MTEPWRPTLVKDTASELRVAPTPVDAQQQAAAVLEQAREQAERLLDEAKTTADQILAQAEGEAEQQRQAGYQAGQQAGLEAGRAEYQAQLNALQQVRQRLVEQECALLEQAEAEIVDMALLIAERVIGMKLRTDDAAVQSSLRLVLNAAMGARTALLMVSPDDFDHLWDKRQEWAAAIPGLREFNLEQSPGLQKGDLVLQSNVGTIDARVETMLAQVADQLGNEAGR